MNMEGSLLNLEYWPDNMGCSKLRLFWHRIHFLAEKERLNLGTTVFFLKTMLRNNCSAFVTSMEGSVADHEHMNDADDAAVQLRL